MSFSGATVKDLTESQRLQFTIWLLLLLLVTPLRVRAQESQGPPASQPSQAVQAPDANTNATTGTTPGGSISAAGAVADANYILGPEDVIKIDVFDVPELTKTVRVANDGMIALPLLGRVPAAGMTAEELRKELADKWGENYLQDPQVTVFVNEFKASRFR